MSRSLTSIASSPKCASVSRQDHRAGDDHRRALRLERRHLAPLRERQRGEPVELRARACERQPVAVHALAVVRVEPEVERGERRHRARDADRRVAARRRARSSSDRTRARARVELVARRRVGVHESLGEAHGAHVEARRGSRRRAARSSRRRCRARASPGGGSHAAARQLRFLVAASRAASRSRSSTRSRRGTPRRSRRRAPRSSRRASARSAPRRLERAAVVGERVAHARDRDGEEPLARVDAFAEPRDARLAVHLVDAAVDDVRDEQPRRVRAEVDRGDSHLRG